MDGQLSLWSGSDTPLASDGQISLSIRESLKARQLILQVLPPRTVEVVVPKGMRPRAVESFIHDHRDWIRRAGQELVQTYPTLQFRPSEIVLEAIGETITVRYGSKPNGRPYFRFEGPELMLHAPPEQYPLLLKRWLLKQGQRHLKPWIMREADALGLSPSGVQIRLQRTRWGSCSSGGNISLNAALLLVAPELVRYLFVHELCHLRHLSHSKRYWQTVARFEPEFRRLDRRLAASWKSMPSWLTVARSGQC